MTSERLYRILLWAYPAAFRREYGEAMAQCFRDQLRAARANRRQFRLWCRTLADFAISIPARYMERAQPHRPLSNEGRLALFFARTEASSFGRKEITLEHLLLGALRAGNLLAPDQVDAIVRAIEAHEPPRRVPPSENLPLSDDCREILRESPRTPHQILTSILHRRRSLAARLLRQHAPTLRER